MDHLNGRGKFRFGPPWGSSFSVSEHVLYRPLMSITATSVCRLLQHAEVGLQLTAEATDITRTDVIDIRQLCLTKIRSGSLPPFVPPAFFSMIGLMKKTSTCPKNTGFNIEARNHE